jgi:hypothetical protein
LPLAGLTIEVLALQYLPEGDPLQALAQFHANAAAALTTGLPDLTIPTSSGLTQSSLDVPTVRAVMLSAAQRLLVALEGRQRGDPTLPGRALHATFQPDVPGGPVREVDQNIADNIFQDLRVIDACLR